ncbi:MAG: CTP synthase, partial [Patescibacteria group bacterium]
IIARAERALDKPRRERLATFCNIPKDAAISAPDAKSVYEVPIIFEDQQFAEKILERFKLKPKKGNLGAWQKFLDRAKSATEPLKIAVVGKYFGTGDFTLADSYLSVIEALKHASWAKGMKPELTWIDSEQYETNPKKLEELSGFDGVIVPGGFGTRGIEGIILAIQYAREHRLPYLGLCYGMQLACIEFARNVAGLPGAHTTEVKKRANHPVIHIMPEQEKKLLKFEYGGTMRLGAFPAKLKKGSVVAEAYGSTTASERHRHRYEFNNDYRASLESAGLVISGTSPDGKLVEMVELPKNEHPHFVGTQAHPEFKSRPLNPHPLFLAFTQAAKRRAKKR